MDYRLVDAIVKQAQTTRPSVEQGMRALCKAAKGKLSPHEQRMFESVDWGAELGRFVKWMASTLARHPLPANVRAVWFGTPEPLTNRAETYVCGYDSYDPGEAQLGIHEGEMVYPPEQVLVSGAEFVFQSLTGLAAAYERMGEANASKHLPNAIEAAARVLTALVIANALPKLKHPSVRERDTPLAVLFGFASGDLEHLGMYHRGVLSAYRRPTAAERRATVDRQAAAAATLDVDRADFPRRIKAYLKAGGDPSARGRNGTPILQRTVSYSDALALIRAGADVNARSSDGDVALSAFVSQDIRVVRALLKAGADPNAMTQMGPVLDLKIRVGEWRHIPELIKAGANLKIRDRDGATALHELVSRGRAGVGFERVYRWLRRAGVGLEDRDKAGLTPLWHAVRAHAQHWDNMLMDMSHRHDGESEGEIVRGSEDHEAVAVRLLELGADANVRTKKKLSSAVGAGSTPLMVERYGAGKLHLALLKHGAKLNVRCDEGLTPLEHAQRALRRARAVWEKMEKCSEPGARRAQLMKYPENPRVIARVIGAMEARVRARRK